MNKRIFVFVFISVNSGFLEFSDSKNCFNHAKIFVLKQFKMECFCEIYQRMGDVYGEACQKEIFTIELNIGLP